MTSLVPAGRHADALSDLLAELANENDMDIDAHKESAYVASDARELRRSGVISEVRRWAIVDDREAVVGYLSGRFKGGIPDRDLPEGEIGSFVSIVAVAKKSRGAGHAWHAIQEFARLARSESGTTVIGLRLDESGDLDQRRTRFQRMGFEFTGLIGTAPVDVLLADRGGAE